MLICSVTRRVRKIKHDSFNQQINTVINTINNTQLSEWTQIQSDVFMFSEGEKDKTRVSVSETGSSAFKIKAQNSRYISKQGNISVSRCFNSCHLHFENKYCRFYSINN